MVHEAHGPDSPPIDISISMRAAAATTRSTTSSTSQSGAARSPGPTVPGRHRYHRWDPLEDPAARGTHLESPGGGAELVNACHTCHTFSFKKKTYEHFIGRL